LTVSMYFGRVTGSGTLFGTLFNILINTIFAVLGLLNVVKMRKINTKIDDKINTSNAEAMSGALGGVGASTLGNSKQSKTGFRIKAGSNTLNTGPPRVVVKMGSMPLSTGSVNNNLGNDKKKNAAVTAIPTPATAVDTVLTTDAYPDNTKGIQVMDSVNNILERTRGKFHQAGYVTLLISLLLVIENVFLVALGMGVIYRGPVEMGVAFVGPALTNTLLAFLEIRLVSMTVTNRSK
jgi:hypothetical protein